MTTTIKFKDRVLSLLTLLLCLALPIQAWAQKQTVTGTVTEQNGEPIIGATIMEKGTTNGTTTDFDGNFSINVTKDAIILVSYVGYVPQEIKVGNKTHLDIVIKEDNQVLDEVVVVGYGTMKKSDMTGAISSVNGSDLAKRTTTNPAAAPPPPLDCFMMFTKQKSKTKIHGLEALLVIIKTRKQCELQKNGCLPWYRMNAQMLEYKVKLMDMEW